MSSQVNKTLSSRDGVPAPSANTPWLVMIYMAGDNNLSEEMVLALQDVMSEGARQGNVIVAQFDPGGAGIATQRYVFGAAGASAGIPGAVTTASIAKLKLKHFEDPHFGGAEVNTGAKPSLQRFLDWAWSQVPHDPNGNPEPMQTLLILSGHGSGATEDFFLKDESSTDALTFKELAEVLSWHSQEHRRIDVLGLDACYMCMGELAYEVRDRASILIGPEGLEPAFGWPYRKILAAIQARGPPGR
jgi:hypothetical protein